MNLSSCELVFRQNYQNSAGLQNCQNGTAKIKIESVDTAEFLVSFH